MAQQILIGKRSPFSIDSCALKSTLIEASAKYVHLNRHRFQHNAIKRLDAGDENIKVVYLVFLRSWLTSTHRVIKDFEYINKGQHLTPVGILTLRRRPKDLTELKKWNKEKVQERFAKTSPPPPPFHLVISIHGFLMVNRQRWRPWITKLGLNAKDIEQYKTLKKKLIAIGGNNWRFKRQIVITTNGRICP